MAYVYGAVDNNATAEQYGAARSLLRRRLRGTGAERAPHGRGGGRSPRRRRMHGDVTQRLIGTSGQNPNIRGQKVAGQNEYV